MRKDPLLAALIAKLPEQGSDWPEAQQIAWLELMAMAFKTVYGGNAVANLAPTKKVTAPKPVRKPGFYIDEQGYARSQSGKRINPMDLGAGDILVDERGQDGDLRAIIWADGSLGMNGKDLTISAA